MAEQINIQVLIDATKSAKTLDELDNSIESINKELTKIPEGTKEFNKLSKALEDASDNSLELALNLDKQTATLGELERSIEVIGEELKNAERGSEAWNRLSGEFVNANRELKNVELSLEALDSEQVASELGSVAGAVGDVTTSFILLGGEGNRSLQEIGQNIEFAIGVSTGLKGAIEGFQSGIKLWRNFNKQIKASSLFLRLATISQTALSIATGFFATVTGAGTTALKLFRIALISTGIGALVVLVGLLIANFDKLLGFFKPIIDGLKAIGDAIGLTSFATDQQIDSINKQVQALKKQEEALRKNNALQKRYADDRIKNLEIEKELAEGNAEEQIAIAEEILQEKLGNLEREREEFRSTQREQLNDFEARVKRNKTLRADELDDLFVNQNKVKNLNSLISDQEKINSKFRQQIAQDDFQTIVEINTKERELRIQSQKEIEKIQKNETKSIEDERKRRADNFKKYQDDRLKAERQLIDLALSNLDDGFQKEDAIIRESFKRQREDLKSNESLKSSEKLAILEQLNVQEQIQLEKIARDNQQKINEIDEEFFQESLVREEDRQVRKLTLEFQKNEERIKKLVSDDKELSRLLTLNREKFFKDIQTIEDNARDLDEKQRQELKDRIISDSNEIALIEKQLELQRLSDKEIIGKKGLELTKEFGRLQIKSIEDQSKIELRKLQEKFEKEKKLYDEQGKDVVELQKQYAKERELIESKTQAQIEEIQQSSGQSQEDQNKALREALIQLGLDTAQQLSDLSFEILQERAERESEFRKKVINRDFDAEIDRLNQKVEDGLLLQSEADRLAKEQERKKNNDILKEQKRLFEETKKRQRTQAVINGALAFTNALATTQPLVPLGLVAGAGVLVSTGVQIAKIESQKFARGGLLKGKSHSNGGIKTAFGELEGGEAVINKKSTGMFKDTLSKINQAGGGVKFADGGILGSQQVNQTGQIGSDLGGILTSLNQKLSEPIRSFVVESDVTQTQKRVSNLERNADL
jgi:ElaB/YqjD/DUF883 family membrane-anchored ribosome-binding protein